MNGIVAVDIGTTSLRATLYDCRGLAYPADQRANMPVHHPDGRVEQDASAWSHLLPAVLKSAASQAAASGVTVAAIALTAQRSSVIPVDRDGLALGPAIMWQDRRTAGLATSLASNEAFVHERSGIPISPVFSALKMLWLKREEPDTYARAHKLVGIQDHVLHLLSGRFVTDQSLASRTNLLNLESRAWDPDLLRLFEVEADKLCDLVPPGSVVGGLRAEMARETGLPAGLPVVSAGGDQQCAALGLGLFAKDRAVANTGTGSYILGHSERPVADPQRRVSCNVAALPGAYVVEAILPSSGTVYRWFKERLWNGPLPEADPWEAINAEAEASGPGAGGLLLLPHFAGSGSPHWDSRATGVLQGLTLSTTRGDIARAVLEGVAMELAGGLALLEGLLGPIAEVRTSGGMTKSELFNRIQADAFGKPVVHRAGGEATSLGAWMAGMVATGLAPGYAEAYATATAGIPCDRVEPQEANHDLYERLRRKAGAVYTALAPIDKERPETAAE